MRSISNKFSQKVPDKANYPALFDIKKMVITLLHLETMFFNKVSLFEQSCAALPGLDCMLSQNTLHCLFLSSVFGPKYGSAAQISH